MLQESTVHRFLGIATFRANYTALKASFKTALSQTEGIGCETEHETWGIGWHQVARFCLFAFLQELKLTIRQRSAYKMYKKKIKRDFFITVLGGMKAHSLWIFLFF